MGYPKPPVYPSLSLKEVKASLLDQHFAKQIISQLHNLPIHGIESTPSSDLEKPRAATAPIHAICLDITDELANEKWFSKLPHSSISKTQGGSSSTAPSVAQADVKSLESFLSQVQIINIVQAPDFGIGQPVEGKGLFSGSIPTAHDLSDGLSKATEQLMTFGFASTAAVWPNHSGILSLRLIF